MELLADINIQLCFFIFVLKLEHERGYESKLMEKYFISLSINVE